MLDQLEIVTLLFVVTVSSLLFTNLRVFYVLLALTLATAFWFGAIELTGILVCFILVLLANQYKRGEGLWSGLSLLLLLVLGLGLGLHVVPGFNNYEYLEGHQLSPTSAEFDIWFNYDKIMFGLILVAIVFHDKLIRSFVELRCFVVDLAPIILVGIPAIYLIGWGIGYSHVDVTPSMVFFPWVIKNLFFTVIAEEMMFRGLIQRELVSRIKSGKAPAIGITVAGVLFGLAHFAGGIGYVFLASLAGILYGYAYHKTGRIEAAFLTHLALNSGHFVFFSYPYFVG